MSAVRAPDPRPVAFGWRFVTPLFLGGMLNPINSTMIAVALVPIGHSCHVGVGSTVWLVAALYLACAIAQPVLGQLADRLGPRRVYLADAARSHDLLLSGSGAPRSSGPAPTAGAPGMSDGGRAVQAVSRPPRTA